MANTFPDRLSTTIERFSYIEKFDTWLNLGLWAKVIDSLPLGKEWDNIELRLVNPLISKLDVEMMKQSNMTPTMLKQTLISPILPSLILRDCLANPPSKCHITQATMRRMRSDSESATCQAFIIQYSHLLSIFGPDVLVVVTSRCPDWTKMLKGDTPVIIDLLNIYEDLLRVINNHKIIISRYQNRDNQTMFPTL